MDRNSIIGFVLLVILGAGYLMWNNHEQKLYLAQKAADSAAVHQRQRQMAATKSLTDTTNLKGTKSDTSMAATTAASDSAAGQPSVSHGVITYAHLSNKLLDLRFSSKGGYPVQATLKKYKTYFGDSLSIFSGKANTLSFKIPYKGHEISTADLYYTPTITTTDSGQRLTMTSDLGGGQKVIFHYFMPDSSYMMSAGFRLVGFQKALTGMESLPMVWTTQLIKTEKAMKNERYNMVVHYRQNDGDQENQRLTGDKTEKMESPVKWFCVRSHFFNSTLIADNTFSTGSYHLKENKADDSVVIAFNTTDFNVPIVHNGPQYNFNFRWLISPNEYYLLRSYHLGLPDIITLGRGIFFFVKYFSMWIIIPLFTFLCSTVGNVGICVILLIFIIRLFLSFFTYKSHLSQAKMRALKPEIDKLKEKFGNDKQQMGMEQMKLYRKAGASPLGGCLPMVLQMPFLLAVYYFIPTAIQLRQVPFLWSKDLSTFDSVLNLPFNIPLYGDHVSLFTLLMAATSLLLALYSKNMTGGAAAPTGNGEMAKMMKWMPYVMPFMFLGWFNGMAAGLSLYYTCSNLISLGQQYVIQKFIIDEDAVLAKIQERQSRDEKGATSKWQQRLEEIQKTQAEKMKNRR